MKRLIVVASLLLSGCANLDYAADQYGNTPMIEFEHGGHPYRVFDKATANRVMITPSLASAVGGGIIRGATFGLFSNYPSEPTLHAAVEAYLAWTGRKCILQPGRLIAQPQWEFSYTCENTFQAK